MMPGAPPLRHLDLDLQSHIRSIPDFPKPGILFRDINPLLRSPEAMAEVIRQLGEFCDQVKPDLIVGIESRGFIFGAPLASDRRLGFVPVRKPGKLPGEVVGLDYALEYGTDRLRFKPMLLRIHPVFWWWTICWPPVERLRRRESWWNRPAVAWWALPL